MKNNHQTLFYTLFDYAQSKLTENETLLGSFYSEDSSFVRFNNGKIRQPGSVNQSELTLELIQNKKHSCFQELILPQ